MRPMDINLKTPNDQTPGPKYYFTVTSSGKDLSYSKKFKCRKTFSTEKRFKAYDNLAQRTGNSVGPGSYIKDQFSVSRTSLSRCTVKYLPTLKKYDSSKNNFYMVGNLLVSDDSHLFETKKTIKKIRKSTSSAHLNTSFLRSSPNSLKKTPKRKKIYTFE